MTTVGTKTYSKFSRRIHNWMEEQHLNWPMEMYDRLKRVMGKDAPSYSQCKMVYYGKRIFDPYVILFMQESLTFKVYSRDCFPDVNKDKEVTKIQGELWIRARGFR